MSIPTAKAGKQPSSPPGPVRVCFLIDRLTLGGTEMQLLALLRHLDRTRVEPFLCFLDGEDELSRSLEPDCCPVLRLGVKSLLHPSALLKALRFARFLRRERVEVLQVYFQDSTYFGVPIARLAGVPRVVRTRFNLGYWMTPVHRRLGQLSNRFVDAVVANCEACREAFIADEGFPHSRTLVLENGVDLGRFPRPALNARPRPAGAELRVGVVANLRPVKGLEDFVRAAALVSAVHPQARFEVAGEGELRPQLQQLAEELGLGSRFRLLGAISDVPGFLSELDVAVLCSHSEGLSNGLLEYMAAAKPVVATAVGGNARVLRNGIDGLLVPPKQPAALAEAITALLANPGRAHTLGAEARRRVETTYSREVAVRRFEKFYWNLSGRRDDGREPTSATSDRAARGRDGLPGRADFPVVGSVATPTEDDGSRQHLCRVFGTAEHCSDQSGGLSASGVLLPGSRFLRL